MLWFRVGSACDVMGFFHGVTPEAIRPVLLRIARLEAAHHQAEQFHDRSPFSEERTRLPSLMAQDRELTPEQLAQRITADPEELTAEAVAWQQSIDPAGEAEAIERETRTLARRFRKLMPTVQEYTAGGGRFGPTVAQKIHHQFRKLGCYFSFSPSRRGFLFGQIRQTEVAGHPIGVLENEVLTGRYNHTFRGHCDKIWDDQTYLRPQALTYTQALSRHILAGDCSVENIYLRKARGIFERHYNNPEQFTEDLTWWIVAELGTLGDQRREIRTRRTTELIQNRELAPAGYQENFYWVFDGAMAELAVLVGLAAHPDGERLTAARRIDRLIHFEPPVSEAAFYYNQGLLMLHAHLTEDPAGTSGSTIC